MGDEEEQGNSIICLFCKECFKNAENVWNHCDSAHGIDLLKIKRMHSRLMNLKNKIMVIQTYL